MLESFQNNAPSLSPSHLEFYHVLPVFKTYLRKEKHEWFPGNPHRKEEPFSGWNYWRELKWGPWTEYRRTVWMKVSSKVTQMWSERKEYLVLFFYNSFCCLAFSFVAQCHVLWLRGNYWTLWIFRTKCWYLPTFKLFFYPKFCFLFIHCLR